MPIFDRVCESCGYTEENVEHLDSSKIKECPQCNGQFVRQIGLPSFDFRGDGFWQNNPKRQKTEGQKEIQNILNKEYKRRGSEPVDD